MMLPVNIPLEEELYAPSSCSCHEEIFIEDCCLISFLGLGILFTKFSKIYLPHLKNKKREEFLQWTTVQ